MNTMDEIIQQDTFTILLVEDNPAHAELIKRSFEDHNLPNKIYHVSDGEASLDYLLRRGSYIDPEVSPRPHVILLDLRLPKVDGIEVLRTIKNDDTLCHLPVVILTTSAADQDVMKAYDHHANSYLVKPVDYTQFNQLMNDLGVYWLQWNHCLRI
ncbi:MAG: response regulator [Pseudomonadota bacterium]